MSTRLARLLLDIEEHGEVEGLSHQDLAVQLAVSREIVSRAMVAFKAEGWLAVDRRSIRLFDREALRAIAEARPD